MRCPKPVWVVRTCYTGVGNSARLSVAGELLAIFHCHPPTAGCRRLWRQWKLVLDESIGNVRNEIVKNSNWKCRPTSNDWSSQFPVVEWKWKRWQLMVDRTNPEEEEEEKVLARILSAVSSFDRIMEIISNHILCDCLVSMVWNWLICESCSKWIWLGFNVIKFA